MLQDKIQLTRAIESKLRDKLTASIVDDVMQVISSELTHTDVTWVTKASGSLDLLEEFISAKTLEGRSKKTIGLYRYQLGRLLTAVGISIPDITVYHLRSYLAAEKSRGVSDRTLENLRSIYSAFFGWLHASGLIVRNPCATLGTIKCRTVERKPFSLEELEKLREACSTERDRAILEVLLSTGCRVSEICGMNMDDIDLGAQEVKVLGKGNKERTVYLDDVSTFHLRRYMIKRHSDGPELFVSRKYGRLSVDGIERMIRKLGERAGVEDTHPHRFRRTRATALIRHGMSVQETAKILGHADINTTMEYVYLDRQDVKQNFRKYA